MKKQLYEIKLVYEDKTYWLEGEKAKAWMDILTKIINVFNLEERLPDFNWNEKTTKKKKKVV